MCFHSKKFKKHTYRKKNGMTYLTYEVNEIVSSKKLKIVHTDDTYVWTVIHSFKFIVAGDLSFFATSTGRDGRSHCRCTYCPLSSSEWKDDYCKPATTTNLTLATIHSYANKYHSDKSKQKKKISDTKGVIMKPLLEIEPRDYIVPLLHLMIGIVNKAWDSFIYFLDEFVENVGEREASLKDRLCDIENEMNNIVDSIEVHTTNRNVSLMEIKSDPEAKEIYELSKKCLSDLIDKKRKLTSEKRSVKGSIEEEKNKRSDNEENIENLLHVILDQCKIKKQHFHGGSMNGVCCRRLLDNVEVIFEKVHLLVKSKMEKRNRNKNSKMRMSQLTVVIDTFQSLFQAMDVVFSKLRIIAPSETEINEIKVGIRVLETIWEELELSVTPKFHILVTHTVEQVIRFDGIADKVEDFVEKAHQIGKKLDHLVARMNSRCFRQKEMVKIRRQWLANDPQITNQLKTISQSRKRKLNNIPSLTKKEIKAKVKLEKRQMIMKTLFDTDEKNNCSYQLNISEH